MSLIENALLTEEQMRRIVSAARDKGITLQQMQADSVRVLKLTERILAIGFDRARIDEMVAEENYHCLACRGEVHDLCVNDRIPGFGVILCQCHHQKGEPNGHDN